ncbi:unnamed protein product [Brassica oleracea]
MEEVEKKIQQVVLDKVKECVQGKSLSLLWSSFMIFNQSTLETLTGDEFRETFIYTDKPLNADDRVRIKDLISV